MVQKRVQKRVQAKDDGNAAMDEITMPQYMSKNARGTGYVFRRAVPEDIRPTIGKREFKEPLGSDYRHACQRCRELAVDTDQQIAAARAKAAPLASAVEDAKRMETQSSIPDTSLTAIHEVTPDLIARLNATVIEQVRNADREQRFRTLEAINPVEKLGEIQRVRSWATLAQFGDETAVYGWSSMLTNTLKRNGYCLAPELRGSLSERELLIEYASAYGDALDTLAAEYSGKKVSVSLPAATLQRIETVVSADSEVMLLSAAINEFLAHLPPAKRVMNEKHRFILPIFLEVVGDMPITDLRQTHVKDFLLTVQKLPPRWSDLRRKQKANIRDLASQTWDKTLSLKTYEDTYRASLRTFLDSAVANWQDVGFPTTMTTNIPYTGSRTKTERKQRAIRPNEIRLIFFNESMEKIRKNPAQVHKFWLLAIELYTGARVREICQLNPQHDWGCRDGHWWLCFTDEVGENPDPDVIKSVKTGKARTIPMHPELVRIGLPEYLDRLKQGGARRLFPQWKPTQGDAGAAPGKWVINYMRSISLHGVANEQGNAVRGSHTFRHTLLTHGRLNGVNLRCISGHQEKTDNPVADGYEDETVLLTLSDMAARLAKLDYGVELPVPTLAQAPYSRQKRTGASLPEIETRR